MKKESVSWVGCGECDSLFPCHEGRMRCFRLEPLDPWKWLNDCIDLIVDLGGAIDEGIEGHIFGRTQVAMQSLSLRSRKLLAELVSKRTALQAEADRDQGTRFLHGEGAVGRWKCGSCRDTGKWLTGIDCPVCCGASKRCTERESGGLQCELPANHEGKHACPEALRRWIGRASGQELLERSVNVREHPPDASLDVKRDGGGADMTNGNFGMIWGVSDSPGEEEDAKRTVADIRLALSQTTEPVRVLCGSASMATRIAGALRPEERTRVQLVNGSTHEQW